MEEEAIRKIVKEAVQETLTGLGFTTEDPREVQQDMIYVRKMRKGSEEMGKLVKRSIITVAIPSFLYVAWEVIKHAINKG